MISSRGNQGNQEVTASGYSQAYIGNQVTAKKHTHACESYDKGTDNCVDEDDKDIIRARVENTVTWLPREEIISNQKGNQEVTNGYHNNTHNTQNIDKSVQNEVPDTHNNTLKDISVVFDSDFEDMDDNGRFVKYLTGDIGSFPEDVALNFIHLGFAHFQN